MMKKLIVLGFAFGGCAQLIGQCIDGAIPIKSEHWSYLREYSTQKLAQPKIAEDVASFGMAAGSGISNQEPR